MTTPDSPQHTATHDLSSELRVTVNRLSRRLRAEKADDDLTDSQTTVLGVLAVRGTLTLSELSEIERVTLPSMNRTVGILADAGYIDREACADDRRKVLLTLSTSGEALVRETRRRRDEWLYQRISALDPSQREALAVAASALKQLCDS